MARGEVLVGFRLEEPSSLRNERGHFTSDGIRELYTRNNELSSVIQYQVARRIENRILFGGRKEASTGRLVAVTVDRRNRFYDRWNVGVGDPKFLDRSVAKYWRTIEEGSAAVWRHPFIGTQLVQIYRDKNLPSGGRVSPGHTNLRTATGGVEFKNNRDGREMYVVTKEIAPSYAYRTVFEEGHFKVEMLQMANRFLDRVFNTPVKMFPTKDRWYY